MKTLKVSQGRQPFGSATVQIASSPALAKESQTIIIMVHGAVDKKYAAEGRGCRLPYDLMGAGGRTCYNSC
jgi:hypothetical protein